MEVFCFFMGVLFFYTKTYTLLIALSLIYFVSRSQLMLLSFALGLALAWIHQWQIAPGGMPEVNAIPAAEISGVIASIPAKSPYKTSFNFSIDQLNGKPAHALVQLAWYFKALSLHPGQRWRFNVKLKKPHNFQNPGSSDYVASLRARHISWVGYIRGKKSQFLGEEDSIFNGLSLRERLGARLNQLCKDKQSASILQALSLNLTQDISQENWELFRRTGTIHLFSISGEHIALIWGLVFFLVRWLWSRSTRLCLWLPAPYMAGFAALLAAFVYAFLAGFGPPVQRALVACFFYALSTLGKRQFTAWQIWRYAMVLVLCLEPHAVFMQGFYFSFLAVSCLLLTSQRFPLSGWRQNLALQLACLIGLMPLSLYWFSYGSINGYLANLFAIPYMGFLIVPLALISLLFSSFDWVIYLIKPLSWLITGLMQGLTWSEHLALINLSTSLPTIELAIALMAALLCLIVLPIKALRGLVMLCFLLPFIPPPPLQKGEALIQVLDVGQGLAVSIRTAHHVLLYDTGDKWFQGNDLGKLVVLPFYKYFKINTIDKLVISHPDKDHRGGLESIEAGMQVKQLVVNNTEYFHRGLVCHQIPSWEWDGVKFRFFPIKIPFKEKNNTSCILQVKTQAGRFLLTGDIEAKAEDYLIQHYASKLQSDLLLVPHHGSKTSSSYRFLLEVAPRYAIASLGFDNRFHFPHAKTLWKFKSLGIEFYRTDTCGMVETLLPAQGKFSKLRCFDKGAK